MDNAFDCCVDCLWCCCWFFDCRVTETRRSSCSCVRTNTFYLHLRLDLLRLNKGHCYHRCQFMGFKPLFPFFFLNYSHSVFIWRNFKCPSLIEKCCTVLWRQINDKRKLKVFNWNIFNSYWLLYVQCLMFNNSASILIITGNWQSFSILN